MKKQLQNVLFSLFLAFPLYADVLVSSTGVLYSALNEGGISLPVVSFELTSPGSTLGVSFDAWGNTGWMVVSPTNGLCTQSGLNIEIQIDCEDLAAGGYTGLVTVSSSAATNPPLEVEVILELAAVDSLLRCDPEEITVSFEQGSANVLLTGFEVWNAGSLAGRMDYVAETYDSWLSISPTTGVSYGEINEHILILTNLAALSSGQQIGSVSVKDTNDNNAVIIVTLNVEEPAGALGFSPDSFHVVTMQGCNPLPQDLYLWNTGGAPLPYRLGGDSSWLEEEISIGELSGDMTNMLYINFRTEDLPAGEYTGSLMIYAPTNAAVPFVVPIDLTVNEGSSVPECSPRGLFRRVRTGLGSYTQQFSVWNAGTGSMVYTVNESIPWLSITPPGGICDGTTQSLDAVFSEAGLVEGTYTSGFWLASAASTPTGIWMNARFILQPDLRVLPTSITNAGAIGYSVPASTLTVWNAASAGVFDFNIGKFADWLLITPTSGVISASPADIQIDYSTAGLTPGIYRETLHIKTTNYTLFVPIVFRVGSFASVVNERILFDSDMLGDRDIWAIDPDGSAMTPFIVAANNQGAPYISPDGRKLAYFSREAGGVEYLVRDLISGEEQTHELMSDVRWMRDGGGLIGRKYEGSDASMLWFDSLTGRTVRVAADASRMYVSPIGMNDDKTALYYTVTPGYGRDIAIRAARATGKLVRYSTLMGPDGSDKDDGKLSPDEEHLMYSREYVDGRYRRICLFHIATGREYQLSQNTDANDLMPAYSPTGDRAAFIRSWSESNALVIIELATSNETVVMTTTNSMEGLSWGYVYEALPTNTWLTVNPGAVTSSCPQGRANIITQSICVANADSGWLSFSLSNRQEWAWTSVGHGFSAGEDQCIDLYIDPQALEEGTHTGRVDITANAPNAPVSVYVQLDVGPPVPDLACDSTNLLCAVALDSNAFKNITVWNAGGLTLTYTVSVNRAWMTRAPSDGTSTGEEDLVTITYESGTYPLGTYTGLVTVSSLDDTQTIVSVMDVRTAVAMPPLLSVSPVSLINSVTQSRYATSQYVEVWNSGGDILEYIIDEDLDWLRIYPFTSPSDPDVSRGEHNRYRVEYLTRTLSAGVYEESFTVLGNGGTQQVDIALTVLPPLQFNLSVSNSLGGYVEIDPFQPFYDDGTLVELTAVASDTFYFVNWTGAVTGARTPGRITIRGDTEAYAQFASYIRLWGYVTNTANGAPLAGAAVRVGRDYVVTDAAGEYSIITRGGWESIRATREGYAAVSFDHEINSAGAERLDIGLEPDMIRSFYAEQRPGTDMVDIYYNLNAAEDDEYTVTLDLSSDGGATWSVSICSVSGDNGTGVEPGGRRHIVWNAETCSDNRYWPDMLAGLVVAGRRFESEEFALDTRGYANWRVRIWADRNGDDGFDLGEQLSGASVYYGNRSACMTTDASGYLTIPSSATWGRELFSRKIVHTEAAVKSKHELVDDAMYNLYLDSDWGGSDDIGWNGIWHSYTLSHTDLNNISRNRPVYLRLAHPVFEWNLVVASRSSSDTIVTQLREGVRGASQRLYDATDGQMKIGAVAIYKDSQSSDDEWKESDVQIFDNTTQWPEAHAGGVFGAGGQVHMGREFRPAGAVYTPDDAGYYESLTHELGHYLLNFRDEYEGGTGGSGAFSIRRAANTNDYPSDYGLMDHDKIELSSYNDYLAAYPAAWSAGVTEHVWDHELEGGGGDFYPCWQWVEHNHEKSYSGYNVEIIVPQYGTFRNGRATSWDREGPIRIPSPYVAATVVRTAATRSVVSGKLTAATVFVGYPDILVYNAEEPVAGAEVVLVPAASGFPRVIGRTGKSGRLSTSGLYVGDELLVYHAGTKKRYLVTADVVNVEVITIVLNRPVKTVWPLSTNSMGMITAWEYETDSVWKVSMESALPLASNGFVTVYFDDAASTGAVELLLQSSLIYTAAFDFSASGSGLLQFELSPSNEPPFSTMDSYIIHDVDPSREKYRSRNDRVNISFPEDTVTTNTQLLIYLGEGPLVLGGGAVTTHQVGAVVSIALADPGVLTPQASFAVNIYYDTAETIGLDETSFDIYRWSGSSWLSVTSSIYIPDSVISAELNAFGVYAVLADSSGDVTPPSTITDLVAVAGAERREVVLTWTAPGDDDTVGQATVYELKYAAEEIVETNWATAAQLAFAISPASYGSVEGATVSLPEEAKVYYFYLRARDEAGNLSGFTNTAVSLSGFVDENGDGISDVWLESYGIGRDETLSAEDDTDGDGLTTRDEFNIGTDPGSADTDGDGLSDGWEYKNGLDPNDMDDAQEDGDGDSLTNTEEYSLGTNPMSADTDGDGMTDDWEHQAGLDPLTAGNEDGADDDPDDDEFTNYEEFIADTVPTNDRSFFHVSGMDWGDGVQITFPSSTRRVYEVDSTTELDLEPTWSPLTPPGSFYGDGGDQVLGLTNGSASNAVYRLRVHQP